MQPKQRSSGGVRAIGVTDVGACKTFCNLEPTCVGFEYRRLDDTCWWHNTSVTDNIEEDNSTDLYVRLPCPTSTASPVVTTTIPGTWLTLDSFVAAHLLSKGMRIPSCVEELC